MIAMEAVSLGPAKITKYTNLEKLGCTLRRSLRNSPKDLEKRMNGRF
jgi:hypothetical protein